VDWDAAALFWFGRAPEQDNYVDVRLAYDDEALRVFATAVDYHLWYAPQADQDPRQFDAFGLYLDAVGHPDAALEAGRYSFASGFRHVPTTSDQRWQRQGRWTVGGWDESWQPTVPWADLIGMRWYRSGPNDNADRDAGWATTLAIPWASLSLAGPPEAGPTWRLGAVVYDRDGGPASADARTVVWPPHFSADAAETWGVLAFDPPAYEPAATGPTTTTVLRRGLHGAVADAYVGGGGTCGGGVFGGGDQPHPSGDLFVHNQADVADFPCFSKTYLRFDLAGIPAGQSIRSARLRLHHMGGSEPTQARPSFIQVYSVGDEWDEHTLTWNNAPMARENLGGTWVQPILVFTGWPGVEVSWDVTPLVAEAHAAGQPANLALYAADTEYHSGKYFVDSESGDWNAQGRPTLIVEWGEPTPVLATR
jgi:hypothetical protein